MTDTPSTEEAPEAEAASAPEVPTRYGAPVTDSGGQTVLHATPDQIHELMAEIKADGFAMCIDLCAVDYLDAPQRTLATGVEPERFEIVYNLLSHRANERIRVRVQVPEATPTVPSMIDLYGGVEAMEREAFDLFGIEFTHHPDLTRILMPEGWQGHPLRKDYAVGSIPVQFKETSS